MNWINHTYGPRRDNIIFLVIFSNIIFTNILTTIGTLMIIGLYKTTMDSTNSSSRRPSRALTPTVGGWGRLRRDSEPMRSDAPETVPSYSTCQRSSSSSEPERRGRKRSADDMDEFVLQKCLKLTVTQADTESTADVQVEGTTTVAEMRVSKSVCPPFSQARSEGGGKEGVWPPEKKI